MLGARKEMLSALRSLIDAALERMDGERDPPDATHSDQGGVALPDGSEEPVQVGLAR